MLTIVDYSMGNLRSVEKAFERLGKKAIVTGDPDVVRKADRLVLPGVGAFADAITYLRQRGLVDPILEVIGKGNPFLGICLGLQMLFEKSFEDGEHTGLGLMAGDVVRFALPNDYKIPHMGWNQLRIRRPAPILRDVENGSDVYFVHSYYVRPTDSQVIAADTDYGGAFPAIVWRDNIVATQFHPEKSQKVGLAILNAFADWHAS